MDQQFHIAENYLRIILTGEITFERAIHLCGQAVIILASATLNKALVDVTATTGELSLMERYLFVLHLAEEQERFWGNGHSTVRVAYLLPASLEDPQHIGEIMAQNRGLILKTFRDSQEALVWLGVQPE